MSELDIKTRLKTLADKCLETIMKKKSGQITSEESETLLIEYHNEAVAIKKQCPFLPTVPRLKSILSASLEYELHGEN